MRGVNRDTLATDHMLIARLSTRVNVLFLRSEVGDCGKKRNQMRMDQKTRKTRRRRQSANRGHKKKTCAAHGSGKILPDKINSPTTYKLRQNLHVQFQKTCFVLTVYTDFKRCPSWIRKMFEKCTLSGGRAEHDIEHCCVNRSKKQNSS